MNFLLHYHYWFVHNFVVDYTVVDYIVVDIAVAVAIAVDIAVAVAAVDIAVAAVDIVVATMQFADNNFDIVVDNNYFVLVLYDRSFVIEVIEQNS